VCGERTIEWHARGAGVNLNGGPVHNDVAFVALTIVFFVLAGLLTIACDRIIGPDPVEEPLEDGMSEEPVAA
jgi:hypothetical protein